MLNYLIVASVTGSVFWLAASRAIDSLIPVL